MLLRRNGYHVLEAESGIDGLKMAKQFLPDLILTDINMPGGSGSTLLRAIRNDSELMAKQVVLMTGNPDLLSPRKGMEEGADDFLVKPVELEALLKCIEARFNRSSVISRGEGQLLEKHVAISGKGETCAWLESEDTERIALHGVCTFGRIHGNTVVLPTPKVSRRHAMIHEQDNEFWLVDLGSTNGISINENRVTHPVRLRDDDRIQMPDNLWKFKLRVAVAPPPKPRQAPPFKQNQLTVADVRLTKCWILLADLQGFTQMSQQVDADKLAPMVGSWIADCQAILLRHRGVLAKFLGDGFLAYWPDRDENAGAIVCACGDFQALQMAALPFRVIVHFGMISFGGHSPDASHTMIGPELNFAFRLEKVASRLDLPWIFSDAAASRLQDLLPLESCGVQKVPDFAPERTCFKLAAKAT
jgi:CheY-like chemotaxis protein